MRRRVVRARQKLMKLRTWPTQKRPRDPRTVQPDAGADSRQSITARSARRTHQKGLSLIISGVRRQDQTIRSSHARQCRITLLATPSLHVCGSWFGPKPGDSMLNAKRRAHARHSKRLLGACSAQTMINRQGLYLRANESLLPGCRDAHKHSQRVRPAGYGQNQLSLSAKGCKRRPPGF